MLRINLLSRDVLERRRYERWYPYAFIATGVILAVLLFAAAVLWYVGYSKQASLQQLQETSQGLKAQADAFGVFEQKEQELLKRQAVAQVALANRINMGQVASDISLVLPDEVWLADLSLSEVDGAKLTGSTPQSASHAMDIGYKSIAGMLVSLNTVPRVYDVWLNSATNATYSGWLASAIASGTVSLPAPVVNFTAQAKLRSSLPSSPASAAASSAPTGTGQ